MVVLCERKILAYRVPPLLPQPPRFLDHDHRTRFSGGPFFRFPLPDYERYNKYWEKLVFPWYSCPSQPLYFSVFCSGPGLQHFEIIINPDQSAVSVHFMNISPVPEDYSGVGPYNICDDTLVSCSRESIMFPDTCTIYIGSTSPNINSHPILANVLLSGSQGSVPSLCPASGRAVYLDRRNNHRLTVLDFL